MRKPILFSAILFVLQLSACQSPLSEKKLNTVKEEIRQSEAAFNEMLVDKGIKEAFLHFAAEEALLVRGSQMVQRRFEAFSSTLAT